MADLDRIRLLAELTRIKTHRAAVITSYNVSFPFFEHVVLPRLRGVGCRHILLLMDAARFAEAVSHPDHRPHLAGACYTVLPVTAPGAFHPKTLLLLGPTHGRVAVGSHNLTLSGFNHNAELTTAAATHVEPTSRRLAWETWRLIRRWLPSGAIAEDAAKAVERLAPWLTTAPPALPDHAVLGGDAAAPLWDQLQDWVPAAIESIDVLGPFFDDKLELLHKLCSLGVPVRIGLIPGQAVFPARRRDELPGANYVNATELATAGRYLHAKAIRFRGPTQDVLVTGSANPSAPAFLGGFRANVEAVVVSRIPRGEGPLGLDRLNEAPQLTAAEWEEVPDRVETTKEPERPKVWVATTEGRTIVLAEAVTNATVTLIGEADITLHEVSVLTPQTRVGVPEDVPVEQVRWATMSRDGREFGRALVFHRRLLRRLCRTGAEQRLTEALQSLESHEPDLLGVLSLLDPLLDQPIQRRKKATGGGGGQKKRAPAPFGHGGAAAEPADDIEQAYGTEGSLGEVLLYLNHRLGIGVDTEHRSEEDLVGSDDERLLITYNSTLDIDTRERLQGRFDSLTKKLERHLTTRPKTAEAAHAHMARLAAVLGTANALVRRTPPQPWNPHDHLRLATFGPLTRLLHNGVAAALVRGDLRRAEESVGPHAEELRQIPPLLAWLLVELRAEPPAPPRHAGRDPHLTERAIWVTLLPALDRDHWRRFKRLVIGSDSADEARDSLQAARALTSHLHAVRRNPNSFLLGRARSRPGDLALYGQQSRLLRVIESDVSGRHPTHNVVWLEVGGTAHRQVPHGLALKSTVWSRTGDA